MDDATCSVDDCTRPVLIKVRGLCSLHYQRWQRHGDPLTTVRRLHGEGQIARGYLLIHQPEHPLADGRGRVFAHRVVLFESIGHGPHNCHWCSTPLQWKSDGITSLPLVVDHLDDDRLNNDIANLVPSCRPCNAARGRSSPNGKGDAKPDWFDHWLAS